MQFYINSITDKTGYITDIYLSDSNKIIGDYCHPVRFDILELIDLDNAIQPLIKKYKKWKKKYGKSWT